MHAERYEIGEDAAASAERGESRSSRSARRPCGRWRARPRGGFEAGKGETNIFITPGYEFRAVDRLLTNFHLPESTLIMLVSAFAGMRDDSPRVRGGDSRALLFYSYGDCMFLRNRGHF